jgi:hypothetical protein
MKIANIRQSIERHGVVTTLAAGALGTLKRIVYVRVWKGLVLDRVDRRFLECGEAYDGLVTTADGVRRWMADPVNELDPGVLSRAQSNGEECYAFVCGKVLASYGWYSTQPTEGDVPGFAVHFDPRFVFMHKGHTHPAHRGRRLHAVGVTRMLEAYQARGYPGVLTTVEWSNLDSLKSCYRMGFRDFGVVAAVRIFGRYFTFASTGCRRYRFGLRRLTAKRRRQRLSYAGPFESRT